MQGRLLHRYPRQVVATGSKYGQDRLGGPAYRQPACCSRGHQFSTTGIAGPSAVERWAQRDHDARCQR